MSKSSNQCVSCVGLFKKLKILQADYQFEIKKLSEDRSTQRAMYQLNTNRQIKKLQQKCIKQRQQRMKQNQSWMNKYDQLIGKQRVQMKQYKQQKDRQIQQFKNNKNRQVQKFKVQIVNRLENEIQQLKQQRQQIRKQLLRQYEQKIIKVSRQNDQKVVKLINNHNQQIKRKCNQYEATIVGIQSEKKVQQNLHKRTKQQSKQLQIRLNQQLYLLKKNIIQHQQKISQLKIQITSKSQLISSLNQQISLNQHSYQQHYQQLQKQYHQKYSTHKQSMQHKLQLLFKKQLENCHKYQKALSKIQEHRQIENQMYQANLNDIKSCVDERPSRLQDVQQIIKLKQKLIKKHSQFDSLTQQLKWYRLQLQNKQQTYNKIFGPESKNSQSIYIKRKDIKLKRAGKSVTTVRQILGSVNTTNNLAPLIGNLQKKLLPPKQNKIL